eukprot:Nitzschia sp. Nitz4//scaffold170_size48074//38980//40860//NITZ4_007112-RA/size48074-processed-gene-0.26-mRNA-1//-1//CDS//3329538661//3030//frame0
MNPLEQQQEEELIPADRVSQVMREQDAELLESMHYASSQVSQYSPGGTPQHRPIDRSLPMEDVVALPPAASMPSNKTPSFHDLVQLVSRAVADQPPGNAACDAPSYLDQSWKMEDDFEDEQVEVPVVDRQPSTSRFRRLLSGEVRSVDPLDQPRDSEEATTASPVSVAGEAATSTRAHQQKEETGRAEQRRVQEAIQFAEAVGESIAIHRDDLCIIDDPHDEEETDDDDDACESKEIIVPADNDVVTIQDPIPSHVQIPPTHHIPPRQKSKRPIWPFSDIDRLLENLSETPDQTSFAYKGICANPPEITKHGISRGNYAQLHRKAWLEVSDKYHRYGKNLRIYYRYWEKLGFPTNQFFDWLDSKGDAAGQPLPHLDECPRSVLDSDTVLYLTNPSVTEGYALEIKCDEQGRACILDVDANPVQTGPDGWIFVLRDGVMYGAPKITSITGHSKQRFHHSSFFGGKAVAGAGILITDDDGYLTRLYPHSGHYRPGEAHMQRMLFFFYRAGVDLRSFEMDTQQFRHVSREKDTGDKEKVKKVDRLHLERAVNVACFLAHKASFFGNGIFDMIHRIRKADATSVTEALDLVDNGGFWQKVRWAQQHSDLSLSFRSHNVHPNHPRTDDIAA